MKNSILAWAAIATIVAGTAVGLRKYEEAAGPFNAPPPRAQPAPAAKPPVLKVGPAAQGLPQRIAIDAAMARRALKSGALDVVLPDGTAYRVRIERQETHRSGQWSLIGRVPTPMGGQAMVLTFGGNTVFGVLPAPDGHALKLTTGRDGTVSVAPAGGLTPDRTQLRATASDYRIPELVEVPAAQVQAKGDDISTVPQIAASQRVRLQSIDRDMPPTQAVGAVRGQPPIDTTPVQINVLALYSPELVALRGSKSAAETEVANLFAIANQAHLDSGSRVRLNMVGLRQVALPGTLTNQEALDTLTNGAYGTDDFEAMRDDVAADLAAYVRPRPSVEDATCGASWLNGGGYGGPNLLQAKHGYVVANVDPCGPYVLAHELGHAMGSAHDKYAQRGADGVVAHGAFAFSFGLRTQTYGTLMSDPGDAVWLARFSSPATTACRGAPCGTAGRIDNVRSLNIMAPYIAAFRGSKGTLSISDAFVSESVAPLNFIIRLSAPAPREGLQVFVDVTAGTATPNVDYSDNAAHFLWFQPGEREAVFTITVFDELPGRGIVENDENVRVHLRTPPGYTVAKADAVGWILDDDPRPVVSLKIHGPPGVALDDTLDIKYIGQYLSDTKSRITLAEKTAANEWTLAAPVVAGAPFRFKVLGVSKAADMRPVQLDEVWEDRTVEINLERTVRVTGRAAIAPGMNAPESPIDLSITQYVDGRLRSEPYVTYPYGDDRFEFYLVPGATMVAVAYGPPYPVSGNAESFTPWYSRIDDVRKDFVLSPVLSTVRSVLGNTTPIVEGKAATITFAISDFPPPIAPITLAWETADGTAKAGTHYLAASGTLAIGPDARTATITVETLDNDDRVAGRTFDIVVTDVIGATMTPNRIRVRIDDDDGRRTGGPGPKGTP